MLENLLATIQKEDLAEQLYHSLVGIEIEENRIDKNGRLSRQEHPEELGSRQFHPYLQTDFGEAQAELITDPNPNIGGVLDQLDALQTVFYRSLKGDDRIWPLSMPPAIDESDRQYIRSHFERPNYAVYRDYLTKKYDVAPKIITGIHLNFSLPDPVVNRLFPYYEDEFATVKDFKNALYFRITQNLVLSRWLLTYLFGASPVAEAGFFDNYPVDVDLPHPVRSIRSSKYGYANLPADHMGMDVYKSLTHFISTIEQAVDDGHLYAASEFYGPVRLRGQEHLSDYAAKGIRYLEFRNFDLTPFTPNGVSRHALYFLKLFWIYLLVTPVDLTDIGEKLAQAGRDNDQVALEDPKQPTFKQAEGQEIFKQLDELAVALNAHSEQITAVDDFAEFMTHPELTPAAKLVDQLVDGSLMTFGKQQAAKWKADRIGATELIPVMYRLPIPAQELVFRAIQLGIRYFVVHDEQGEALLMLTYDGLTQVVEANKIPDEGATDYLRQLFPDLPIPSLN